MQVYLATLGRGKVGFTVVEREASGQPVYVGSVRGVVERNTMRYYLAIDASGRPAAAPARAAGEAPARLVRRDRAHPRQLHELERDEYLEMKRQEFRRQQAAES